MSILHPYSRETAELLANVPAHGAGRHHWLFSVAAKLIRQGADPAEVRRRLEHLADELGWHDRSGQIRHDIAKICENPDHTPDPDRPKFPLPDHEARRARFTFPAMFEVEPAGITAKTALQALFPADAWVCVSKGTKAATTQRLGDILDIAETLEFVVANPMRSDKGTTGGGRTSARSKGNAVADDLRRWLVVEFDTGETLGEQASVLSSLTSPQCPLRLAVYSGGKSMHGWFDGASMSPSEKRAFFLFAAYLGADRTLWDPSKLVRMPGGTRQPEGCRQEIMFANLY